MGSLALHPIGYGNFNPFQFITHMFMHGGFMHILMNMLGLVFLGPTIERRIGYKNFIWFYLISGVFAALFHMFMTAVFGHTQLPMVGASGAVFTIITGFGFLFPNKKLQIWPIPIGIKAKWFSGLYFIGEIVIAIISEGDGVAHWAHVGGGLCGLAILYYITKIKKQ